MPLNITIASYGPIGKACSALLQQDGYLNDNKASKYHQVTWMDLDSDQHQKTAEASTSEADIVIILGDNTAAEAASVAVEIARNCAERKVPCYALLGLPTEQDIHNPLHIILEESASNTLFITQDRVTNSSLDDYLAKAVLNVLHPITGRGIIGVDYADISTLLRCGKQTTFSVAEASGEERATLAALAAVSQLPERHDSRSIICNITSGYDLTMKHFELIGNIVHEAIPDDAIVICSTTLDKDLDERIQVGITAMY